MKKEENGENRWKIITFPRFTEENRHPHYASRCGGGRSYYHAPHLHGWRSEEMIFRREGVTKATARFATTSAVT